MFKDKIKFLCKHQGLSQEQVAKEIDILQSTYNRYEQETHEPDFETLKKLDNFFDMSIDYLLENNRSLSDIDEIVDLNDFLLNCRYTINFKFLSDRERRRLNDMVKVMYDDK